MSEPVEFIGTARYLLGAAGRDDVKIKTTRSKSANAFAGRDVITIGQGMADESPEMQRWSAAHEAAHIVLGHSVPAVRVFASFATAAAGFAALAVLGSPWINPSGVLGLVVVIIAGLAVEVGAIGGMVSWARTDKPKERAADRLAAEWGYPVTEALAAQMAGREAWLTQTRLWKPFRRHDLPFDRVNADISAADATSAGPTLIDE